MSVRAGPNSVDVNLFVFNGAATVAAAIDSVLSQTWPHLTLTVIDNASTDGTPDIVRRLAAKHRRVRLLENRGNAGPVLNCQRAFAAGNADFVLPKTADDLLAPDFVAAVMDVLLAHPQCAMCHAAGLVFQTDPTAPTHIYPPEHCLHAIGPDRRARAGAVMRHYTSAPSFWGIYRRAATDPLARIAYRAGWDHVLLAELALHGEIRHVPELLFWRRDGGKAVGLLARGCTEAAQRGLPLDDGLAELRWRTPLITTAYAHVEMFALAREDAALRADLMQDAQRIFTARWHHAMRHEAEALRAALPALVGDIAAGTGVMVPWRARQLTEALHAVEIILPDQDFAAAHQQIAALAGVILNAESKPSFFEKKDQKTFIPSLHPIAISEARRH